MEFQAALCQTKPALGNLDQNLSSHLEWLEKAAQKGADLALFPELSLTGYLLRDLTQEIALPLDANPVKELVARSRDMSIVFGLVEESPDHRFFNSAVFAEGGEILHVHRKVFLPDYGIFEEGRYFASGNQIQPIQSRLGKFGLLICEDAWHLSAGWLQFLQGVDAFLIPAASPARGIDTDEDELSSETSWRTLTHITTSMSPRPTCHFGRSLFKVHQIVLIPLVHSRFTWIWSKTTLHSRQSAASQPPSITPISTAMAKSVTPFLIVTGLQIQPICSSSTRSIRCCLSRSSLIRSTLL